MDCDDFGLSAVRYPPSDIDSVRPVQALGEPYEIQELENSVRLGDQFIDACDAFQILS